MYCICCKEDKVRPYDGFNNMENKPEEDSLWLREPRSKDMSRPLPVFKTVDNLNVMDGIIQRISAGYGSKHDTDIIIIAICDDCISLELSSGVVLYAGNYMNDDEYVQKEVEKSKQIYRRRKNLDGLV